MHTHLREPGFEHKETIQSGCRAGAVGGYTAVAPMANTDPVADDAAVVRDVMELAKTAGLADVFPIGAITKGRDGKELAEIGSMHQRGAIAFSDDGVGVADASVMRKALQYCRMFDAVIMKMVGVGS